MILPSNTGRLMQANVLFFLVVVFSFRKLRKELDSSRSASSTVTVVLTCLNHGVCDVLDLCFRFLRHFLLDRFGLDVFLLEGSRPRKI